MMPVEPKPEHAWLTRLVGEWTCEVEANMGPDQPPMTSTGTETVRAVGDVWIMGEGRSQMPDGSPARTFITLGYDPEKQRFVGTFVGSMMTNLWVYEGALDESGKVLTLDTTGPDFSGAGGSARYQDIVTIVDDDYRTLSSQTPDADGNWQRFMTAHYRRVK